jgi:hypothetical protein
MRLKTKTNRTLSPVAKGRSKINIKNQSVIKPQVVKTNDTGQRVTVHQACTPEPNMHEFLNVGKSHGLKSGNPLGQKIRHRLETKATPTTVNATITHNQRPSGGQHKSHLTPGPGTYKIMSDFDEKVKRAKLFSRVNRSARFGKNSDEVEGP